MKRTARILALLLAAIICLSLTACGGGGGGGSTAAAPGSMKEIKVNIWDNNQLKGIQEICNDWSAKSGIKVNVEVVDWNNYWTLLEAGASGGEMPDVFWMHSNTAQMYMENDILLKLNDYIAADANTDLANYYDGVVKLFTRSDGNVYAIPKDHDTIAMLYNKAIFDKYGVGYPQDDWTWEDVYEAAKAITEASNGDVYGFCCDTTNNQAGWYNVVYAYGGQIITDDHKDTTIDSPEGKAGMEMMRKILTVSTPQAVVSETNDESLFKSGKVAMIPQGSWMVNAYYTAENSKDYAWSMIPYADRNGDGQCQKEERWSSYNGLGWVAKANVADPQAAYDLIAYLCSAEGQQKQSDLGVTMAGMLGKSEAFANAFEGMDLSAFTKVEEEGSLFFRPYTRKTTVWEDALKNKGGLLEAWTDPSDPALMVTACDNAAKIIRDAIAAE